MYRTGDTRYYRAQANEITFDLINRAGEWERGPRLVSDVISMFDNVNVAGAERTLERRVMNVLGMFSFGRATCFPVSLRRIPVATRSHRVPS